MENNIYDVIVVGGGHAGCEAALASARMGCNTLLITLHLDTIGFMSCNPAVGGVGKGQLVREIDALGGEMAKAADSCGIQFRILNASKGPAVHSSRAQVDRKKYYLYMQKVIFNREGLTVHEAKVVRIIVKNKAVWGVETDKGEKIQAKTVIVTPGTFLNGLIHIGMRSFSGGRIEEKGVSSKLSDSLRELGFNILRFKTGTCARLDGKTIDFSGLRVQEGDSPPKPFSLSTNGIKIKQVPCYITYTNEKTHSIIQKNLGRSPLFSGKITGTGVRYCPSLEDKVVKFAHHERHQIFLEPEGLDTDEYYPNGLSTSLPEDVQEDFIRSVPGLENVKINRFGYGIEHDTVDPTQLYPTLETKLVKNLYLAGQINCTTGYEEAAAQGLVSGINAALRIRAKSKEPFILDRTTSYIGVLLDDLTTKGTSEPYRMFTSRVEHRLVLREDNADLRLRELGYKIGLVSDMDYKKTKEKKDKIKEGLEYLRSKRVKSPKSVTLEEFLRRPEVTFNNLKELNLIDIELSDDVINQIETEVKYHGYFQKELTRIKRFKDLEKIKIPQDMDYTKIHGLSKEIIEKLTKVKPLSLGQAGRISGVTPAAVSILMIYLKGAKRPHEKPTDKYYRFSTYLKERFGCRVYKVSIDAGFSCPNRDGKLSKRGCIYCDNRGFSLNTRIPGRPLEQQIKEGIGFGRERFKAQKFMCYFQAYTNTYAPIEVLKEKYDTIRNFDDVVGISIGTRPDCINNEILDLIEGYTKDYEVWLEYGLQSIHPKTLKFINRGHSYEDFLKAVELTRKRRNIKICAHIIIGLPDETKEDILETAKALGQLKIDGIKIHPLHIIKGTKLEGLHKKLLDLDEYVDLATEFLEYLWPKTIIQRITAECPREMLVGPSWILDKDRVLNEIEYRLGKEGRYQGRLFK